MNTLAVSGNRVKFFKTTLNSNLRNSLVAAKICDVDETDEYIIHNPYMTTPTTTIQAMAGTYTLSTVTTTIDDLTVVDEFIVAGHIYDFERVLSHYDLTVKFIDEMTYSVKAAIDKYVNIFTAYYKSLLIDLEARIQRATRGKQALCCAA